MTGTIAMGVGLVAAIYAVGIVYLLAPAVLERLYRTQGGDR